MKKRPNLSKTPTEVIEYIKELEGALFGSSRLEQELRLACDDVAEELAELRAKGNMLTEQRYFDRVLQLFDKTSKIKALNQKKGTVEPTPITPTAEEPDEIEEPIQKRLTNIQDFVIQNRDE